MEYNKKYPNIIRIISSHEPNLSAAADWLANALDNITSDSSGAVELAEIAELPIGSASKVIKAVRDLGPKKFLELTMKEEHCLVDWVKTKARG